MKNKILAAIDAEQAEAFRTYKTIEEKDKKKIEVENKRDISPFEVGDTIDIHQRILEGEKERVQVYTGVVIAKRGEGVREMFTVRRIVGGEGVERVFPLLSPKIAKIEVKKTGKVRRAKLYFLRKRVGKATRLREREKKAPKPGVGANGAAAPAGAPRTADTTA
jgi:large subunit ribosomal protein L19